MLKLTCHNTACCGIREPNAVAFTSLIASGASLLVCPISRAVYYIICDRTCRNQPYGAICNFSLRRIYRLAAVSSLFIFFHQNDGVPLWSPSTKFHSCRSFLSAIKYRCIAYDLYVRRTSHGKLAIRVNKILVDMMRYNGCRNFPGKTN